MKRYWVISPYHSKTRKIFEKCWEYDLKNGTIAIGWNKLGNTTGMRESELKSKYKEVYGKITSGVKMVWKFYNEISPGDIVIARRGRKKIIGIGTVESKAYYNEEKGRERVFYEDAYFLPNFINVKWEEKKIDFAKLVFGMLTVYKIQEERYNSLIKGEIEPILEISKEEKEIAPEIIEKIIRNYKKWSRRVIDESNTKSIFIEPLINSLGWNVRDLDVVEREVKVFGGGKVDYSLKLEGRPVIYIEAKAIKEPLSDEKFIAQAVNYANNDGVLWCLLTNGMDYRLYKSDEKGTISDKLMFKFSLRKVIDNPNTINEILEDLKLLSIENVKDKLSEKAKVVFIDSKVKKVIEKLKRAPSRKFINIIRDELNKEYTRKEIKDSILRI